MGHVASVDFKSRLSPATTCLLAGDHHCSGSSVGAALGAQPGAQFATMRTASVVAQVALTR
jgi:hypothetical protein